MTFPIIGDYKTALANAGKRFSTLDVTPLLDANQEPVFIAGNFAAVFKATMGETNESVAIKCFTRDLPDLAERHRAIVQTIERPGIGAFVKIDYIPDEIFVTSLIAPTGDYPVVMMPWIEGNSLGAVVAKFCAAGNQKVLIALARAWANLCHQLLSAGIAHGDLKHDNVLVTADGKFKLIDYDSMFAPSLKKLRSVVLGGASYQHPGRTTEHFDATLDHFSMLVILLSLRALGADPSLYEAYHTGENIILTRDDFVSGGRSEALQRLRKSPDPQVRDWTAHLIRVAQSDSIAVPGLARMMDNARRK